MSELEPERWPLLADRVIDIALRAAEKVMGVYKGDFDVFYKSADDPVTQADRIANDLITRELGRLTPTVPVVAEESPADLFDRYRDAPRLWFVDPLDGTRDFIARNGEFAVMIGLCEAGTPVLGVICTPIDMNVYVAYQGGGAFRKSTEGVTAKLSVSDTGQLDTATFVASRSRSGRFLDCIRSTFAPRQIDLFGSAGIKALRVAQGLADVYLHLGPAGQKWDSCAPQTVVMEAGGCFTDSTGLPIDYRSTLSNHNGILCTNRMLHSAVLSQLSLMSNT